MDWERCVVEIKKFPNVKHKKLMAFDKVHGESIMWFALKMVDLCVGVMMAFKEILLVD